MSCNSLQNVGRPDAGRLGAPRDDPDAKRLVAVLPQTRRPPSERPLQHPGARATVPPAPVGFLLFLQFLLQLKEHEIAWRYMQARFNEASALFNPSFLLHLERLRIQPGDEPCQVL